MALNKNLAMSPSSSVRCGQYDTTYTTIGWVLREAFADDRIWGVHREPACSACTKVYMKPRTMSPADEDDLWCGHSLEHGETIDALNFA